MSKEFLSDIAAGGVLILFFIALGVAMCIAALAMQPPPA